MASLPNDAAFAARLSIDAGHFAARLIAWLSCIRRSAGRLVKRHIGLVPLYLCVASPGWGRLRRVGWQQVGDGVGIKGEDRLVRRIGPVDACLLQDEMAQHE